MRITAGKAKGRKLKVAAHTPRSPVRPTAAKVREAIFNIIGEAIHGSVFLDLYAGTGAVGMEALSRGAKKAIFVETNPIRCNLIKKVARNIGFQNQVSVYKMAAFNYIKKAIEENKVFDFIFIDPPYQSDDIMKILPLLGKTPLLQSGGMIIIEHFAKRTLPEQVGSLTVKKRYRYGDTAITTYKRGG